MFVLSFYCNDPKGTNILLHIGNISQNGNTSCTAYMFSPCNCIETYILEIPTQNLGCALQPHKIDTTYLFQVHPQ